MNRFRDLIPRLDRLREKRHAEDDRQVCMQRARILWDGTATHGALSRVARQAAILRDLCQGITPVIEPEDLIVGRMPEVIPSPDEELFIADHPEFFCRPGVPGWLDSLSIYVPEWDRLLELGLGGLADEARGRLAGIAADREDGPERREFMAAAIDALGSVSRLIQRYAGHARDCADREADLSRRHELREIARRCERVAVAPPGTFVDALQLIQLVHMVLSCLVGGRDVTPGRMDQYLRPFYEADTSRGELAREDAVGLLAMFLLRLTQMAGSGTDFDDDVRRTPCRYTHLYVTVGGVDPDGRSVTNDLSYAILDAACRLDYREPTFVVRYRLDADPRFRARVAELVRDRVPITIYNDDVVIQALTQQGIALRDARGYAHSACHNVIVVGCEAGSGPGGFHNVPRLLLLAMNGGRDLASDEQVGAPTPEPGDLGTFGQLTDALRTQMRFMLGKVRESQEARWRREAADSCPLLQSCLMTFSFEQQKACWRAAPVSHFNHYLMGLATAVDSLAALRLLVYEEGGMALREFLTILRSDWEGHESLRRKVRTQCPRYGQHDEATRQMAAELGRMWVEEVERAARGMSRFRMWPSFYSHLVHVHSGKQTPATPDGRRQGEALSENVAPSFGTPRCQPTSILHAMSALPFDHTPSGAASLTLCAADLAGEGGPGLLTSLVESYFRAGGLHLQINVLEAGVLERAMATPESYGSLVVRVTGFSAYFTRLSRDVQQDLVRRYSRDGAAG